MRRALALLLPLALLAAAAPAPARAQGAPAACLVLALEDVPVEELPRPAGTSCGKDGLRVKGVLGQEGASLVVRFSYFHAFGKLPEPQGSDRLLSPVPGGSDPVSQKAGVRVTAYLNASWAGGCRDLRGELKVFLDGREAADERPSQSLAPLCGASEASATLLPPALDVLSQLAGEMAALAPDAAAALAETLAALPPVDATAQDAAARADVPEDAPAQVALDDGSEREGFDARNAADVDVRKDEAPAADARSDVGAGGVQVTLDTSPGEGETLLADRPGVEAPAGTTGEPASPPAGASPAPGPAAEGAAPPASDEDLPLEPAPADGPGPGAEPVSVASARTRAPEGPAGAAVAAAAAGALLLLLAAVALYQRIGRHRALDHPARAALHQALAEAGRACTASEAGRAAGVPTKAALYHLRYLARLALVREERAPGEPARFALPRVAPAPAPAPLDARVLDLLARRPGLTTGEMAEALDAKYGRLDRVLKGLLLEGKLESRVEAGRRAYRPATRS